MFEKNKFKRVIVFSFSIFLCYSCAKKKVVYLNADSVNEKRINAISFNAANSTFKDGTSSHVSYADIEERIKNCSIDNSEFKNEIHEIFKEYSKKDLLSHVGNSAITILSILNRISKLTQSEKPLNTNIYACYYPELFLVNAQLMNILQRVPLAPFNQESLSTDDPAENENWNEQDNFYKSRFAKLNGLIRSAAIAYQLVEKGRSFEDKIPRIYSEDENGNKKYLFGFKEDIREENLDYQLRTLAEAFSAIGFYERAVYRWNGVTSAKELNMPVTLPNESLQDDLKQIISQLKNTNSIEENNKLPLKLIIAADLLKAGQFATAALSGNNCSTNKTGEVPTDFISLCSELSLIKEKAIKIDLKRLVCSSASKVAIEKSPADLLANMFWNEAQCDAYIKSEPELSNSFLNIKGLSYNYINPGILNPLRLQRKYKRLHDQLLQINQPHLNYFGEVSSYSPILESISKYSPIINEVGSLAKDYLNLAANKVLNMPSVSMIFVTENYSNILDLISRTKISCSYLASFKDAQSCMIDLKILQEELSFKNDWSNSQKKIISLKFYSSDIRDKLLIISDDHEQMFDNQFLDALNTNGISSLNFNEKFLSIKNLILGEFNNEYYNSRLIEMTVNIIQENPRIDEYNYSAFKSQDGIAYLMRDGLDKNSLNSESCGDNFINYNNDKYSNFMKKLEINKNKYGKSFPYLFNPVHTQNFMCSKVKTTYSELPENNNLENRYTSLKWLQLLSKDPSSSPSVNDIYWKSLTGYLSNVRNEMPSLVKHTNNIIGCLESDELDLPSCAIAKDSVEKSFAGLPFLGNYTFVYTPHHLDELENGKRKIDQKIKIVGVEFKFLISN